MSSHTFHPENSHIICTKDSIPFGQCLCDSCIKKPFIKPKKPGRKTLYEAVENFIETWDIAIKTGVPHQGIPTPIMWDAMDDLRKCMAEIKEATQ